MVVLVKTGPEGGLVGVVKEDLRCDDIYDNCGYIYIIYVNM